VHLEVGAVQVQVLQVHVAEGPVLPGVELALDRLADPRDGRLGQGRLAAEGLGQGGFDVPDRQAPHEPGDDQALQRVGAGHADAEQPGGERLVRAAQLRPVDGHRAGGGLDRRRAVPVPAPGTGPLTVGVALPTEELGHLGLHRGLHQQTHPEAGHLLQHVNQVTVGSEQLVDLSADALQRGYSRRHGCRSPSSLCNGFGRNLRP
jgi:hypothetical protein